MTAAGIRQIAFAFERLALQDATMAHWWEGISRTPIVRCSGAQWPCRSIWTELTGSDMGIDPPFTLADQIRTAGNVARLGAAKRPPRLLRPMQATAASSQVLAFLREDGKYLRACEIISGTGRTHAAVSWALLFLRARGLIERVPDSARNARYLRYRARN